MTDYRVYRLDAAGNTIGDPVIINCDDDKAALVSALTDYDGAAMEIWEGPRRVVAIPADRRISPQG
ncbi:hypothetical protein SAMN05444170_5146 [Bradyrhizobium erythrophlei]|jgi:hypothetical protein|uniref:Uncharacterized protein n=1 Tax=Bradyrhizobium erythrophlei TaxID=1437360 RepID=A0A1M7UI41_9BRAD|nr:hypothetical protein SAMN05444170_5146 [Bradyrhizobium erythrophlei]